MVKNMEKEGFVELIVVSMKETFRKTICMEKESIIEVMGELIKDNGNTTKCTELEYSNDKME